MKPSGSCGHCYWLTTAIVTASTFGNPASLNLTYTIATFQQTALQLFVTRIAFIPSSAILLRALAHIHDKYFYWHIKSIRLKLYTRYFLSKL